MKKYVEVFKTTWEEYMTYRLNFVMWRFRVVIRLLIVFFLWNAIFGNRNELFGYDKSQLITYILGTSIVNSIVLNSRTIDVGGEINEGKLTNYLLKPISYFKFWFSKDMADKLLNLIFSIFEFGILLAIFKPPLFIQTNSTYLLLTFITVFIAMILYFFVNLLFGFIAFWSPDIWPPRFIFFIIVDFLAGFMFPLDILPKPVFDFLSLTPFPYLLYFPLKIYTGTIQGDMILKGLIILLVWVIVLEKMVQFVWKKGLKVYSAEGR